MKLMRSLWLAAPLLAAGAITPAAAQSAAPQNFLGMQWDTALRYWYSTGTHQFDLFGVTGSPLISRLTWNDITGHAAETYLRGDHPSGVFIKGIIGDGSLTGGSLRDEDFPPVVVPYSSTNSDQRNGHLNYWTVDVGYTFLKNQQHRLGGFVGYGEWFERMHAFGCEQNGGAGSGICAPTIPFGHMGITHDYEWSFWRLGLAGDMRLTDRLTLSGDVAWLFGASVDGGDRHHFRPAGLPNRTPIDGDANGIQAEAILSYAVDSVFSIGVGARYWRIGEADGLTHFEVNGGSPQVSRLESERYGVFVQGSYKLGATPGGPAPAAVTHNWAGPYAGLSLGYASGTDDVALSGDPALFAAGIAGGFIPASASTTMRGIVGGAQVGYNWLMGHMILGVVGDISAAGIGGASSYTDLSYNTTVEREINWLATVRGRAGFLLSPTQHVYATAGLAVGDATLRVATNDPACLLPAGCTRQASGSDTAFGWTGGFGYEQALGNGMTWTTEYLYVDLGSQNVTVIEPLVAGGALSASSDFTLHLLRTGISWRF